MKNVLLHECVLSECSRELSKVGLLDLFEISEVELTEATLDSLGDIDYILHRLQSEIQTQYINRKQNLLKTIYTYIANGKTNKEDISYSLYGTNSFNLIWEKVCSENFGSVLDRRISELPLSDAPEYEKIKNNTLRSIIDRPHWHRNNPMCEDGDVDTLKPDLICVYPVNEKDYCFGIYDAKYYCIDFEPCRSGWKVIGQPGVGDVTKQYLYQLAYDDFIEKQGYKYVQNMFFCPQETAEKNYGYVEMNMIHQIGNKKLENIAIVKLCAVEMYDLYLSNRQIEEKDMAQYIPTIGHQNVENENFANRMMAYLRRITQASKVAEEKLEMKAEKGRLIYPKQIKRELGAKIIYDAICPVATGAFYGFDPYEKESYGNMVAEDLGDSYVRCSQIADVSLQIEKNIKNLSEQELQDETVFEMVLKQCFENKDDISSMAEGKSLEKLTKRVMELVRDVYL